MNEEDSNLAPSGIPAPSQGAKVTGSDSNESLRSQESKINIKPLHPEEFKKEDLAVDKPEVYSKPVAAKDDADVNKSSASADDSKKDKKPKTPEQDPAVSELQTNKKYFLPLAETEQRKSLKISFGLVIAVLLLAIILIDLMLDSGLILLIQKVPHTHFFELTGIFK